MNKDELYQEYLKFVNDGEQALSKEDLFSMPIGNFDIKETSDVLINDLYYISYAYSMNRFKAFVFYERNTFIKKYENLYLIHSQLYLES